MRQRCAQGSNPSTRPSEADEFWASVLMAVAAVEDRPPPRKERAPETGQPPVPSTPAKRVRVRRLHSSPSSAGPSRP